MICCYCLHIFASRWSKEPVLLGAKAHSALPMIYGKNIGVFNGPGPRYDGIKCQESTTIPYLFMSKDHSIRSKLDATYGVRSIEQRETIPTPHLGQSPHGPSCNKARFCSPASPYKALILVDTHVASSTGSRTCDPLTDSLFQGNSGP